MAELFQRDKSTISRHIKNIFTEGELRPEATVAKFATVQTEGNRQVTRDIDYYNLDVIISVGYRVKSLRGTQFRIWASSVLKEYMKKGFALDDDRLKRRAAETILTNCLPVSETFGLQKRCFGEKYLRFMQPALIMIQARKPLFSSLSRYKIKCTGQHIGIQRLKSYISALMRRKKIWG